MYSKMFELINDELKSLVLTDVTPKNRFELKKIEIKGIKVKFVYFDRQLTNVKTRLYEMDWFSTEPKLRFKKDYLKPYKDKYFR